MNLDNIFQKAKDVFENAYKKADNVVNVQKQKLDISSLENKINKDYENLGRLCAEAAENGILTLSDECKEIIAGIGEKEQRLEELQKDLLKAKNKKICPKCAATIDKNSLFCNACGVKFDETEKENEENA